jgi:carboxymethylenebutenolidase
MYDIAAGASDSARDQDDNGAMALQRYIAEEIATDCAEGFLTRREALRRLGLLGFSAAAAGSLLAACGGDDGDSDPTTGVTAAASSTTTTAAAAETVPPASSAAPSGPGTAPASTPPDAAGSEEIRFPGPNGELIGVLAHAAQPAGAVFVIHENQGLSAHIRTIPGRLAADGYTALAVDLLSAEGGTAALPGRGEATAALGNAPTERLIADLRAGLDHLASAAPGLPLAAIGFCFGGGMTWELLAAGEPRLAAAVPFYGPTPDGADFSDSPNAAVLGIYAGIDDRVNATRDAAEAALTAAGLVHELRTFDGAEHAFFNDTAPRYNAEAAAAAYQAMLDWFALHLA